MSIALMAKVWESELPTQTHKLVLLAFADYADEDGMCWPSIGRIATRSQISHRQVQRITASLKEVGLLEVLEKERQHKTPTYKIREDRLTPLPESGMTDATVRGDILDDRGDKSDIRGDAGVTQTISRTTSIEPLVEPLEDFLSPKEINLRKHYAESLKNRTRK